MNQKRGNFGSMLGVVLATAGSAVGLGNVWRFPYMTGQNGGAAFILIYIACILVLGIPGMISEFVVGRHSQTNAYRAYDRISGGKAWRFIGLLGVLTSMIILGFYAVVAGWCLQYLYAAVVGQVGGDATAVSQYFQTFHPADAYRHYPWGAQGYRESIEVSDASLVNPAAGHRGVIVYASRGCEGHRVPVSSRLLEGHP